MSQTGFESDFTKINGTDDINEFNRLVNESLEQNRIKSRETEKERLEQLDQEFTDGKQIQDMTFWELFFNMKSSINDTLNDIFQLRLNKTTFTKENRSFYIGLLLLFIVLIFYILDILFSPSNKDSNKPKIYQIEFKET